MKKLLGLLFITTFALVGCSKDLSGELIIAAEGDTYNEYFTEAAKAFTEETGVKVSIKDASMIDTLDALPTQKGNSVDILMIPNDRIGDLADKKLIAPVTTSLSDYSDTAKKAATYNDSTYILPMSSETTVFIYNSDLMEKAPASLKELDSEDWAAKYTDFYFAAGMFMDTGATIFEEGTTNPTLASEAAIKAGENIQKLYETKSDTWTAMKDDAVSYDIMMDAFKKGEIKAMINGPWSLADVEEAGIDYGIVPIPDYEGAYSPLVGTKGLGINGYSKNPEAAQEFLKFISTGEYATKFFEKSGEVSPHKDVKYEDGSNAANIMAAIELGEPMPTTPEFSKVWEPMADALKQIASGEDVKAALEAANAKIEKDIKDM